MHCCLSIWIKTIKTEEQVETLLEIPVLGVIADFEVKKKKEKRYRKIGLGASRRSNA